MTSIGKKTFCSSTNTATVAPIYQLAIDFDVVAKMDKCMLQQLGIRNANRTSFGRYFELNVVVWDFYGRNLTEVCNCEIFNLLQIYRIDLIGVCADAFNKSVCAASSEQSLALDEECRSRDEFKCPFLDDSTTSTRRTETESTTQRPIISSFTTSRSPFNCALTKFHISSPQFIKLTTIVTFVYSILFLIN